MNDEVTKYAIQIPHLGLILTHTWDGEIKGLKEFPKEDRPDSSIIFWTFRLMAGLGMLMVLLALIGLLLRRRGRIFENRTFHRLTVAMSPAGFVAPDRRLDHDGGRPPTVRGLWLSSDGSGGVSRHEPERQHFVDDLRAGLLRGLRHGHLLHLQVTCRGAFSRGIAWVSAGSWGECKQWATASASSFCYRSS
jgi:cytochrome d ubiquinol oxidase subunit I